MKLEYFKTDLSSESNHVLGHALRWQNLYIFIQNKKNTEIHFDMVLCFSCDMGKLFCLYYRVLRRIEADREFEADKSGLFFAVSILS